MKGFRFALVIGIITLVSVFGSMLPAGARAPFICEPLDNPARCEAAFDTNQQLTLRAGVPFVWLRKDPSSAAEVVGTVNYSASASLTVVQWPSTFDAYQNWWLVGSLADKSLSGWVEQSSLVDATSPEPSGMANWSTPFTGGVRAGIPFVWIRGNAYSTGGIVGTLLPKDLFTVVGNPMSDGRQWWWYVRANTSAVIKEGYIEQASIAVNGTTPPTFVPSPVPSLVPSVVPTNVADTLRPTCGMMTVSPATYRAPDVAGGGAIYYVTPGSNLTFRVEGLSNLASITFNVPSSTDTMWRFMTQPRRYDFPGDKAEVYLTVPQAFGWASVSAEAVGLNSETIQCGGFWIDNGKGALGLTATPES